MYSLVAVVFLASRALADTVHGVVVFSRHGDRTTKHYGAQQLTPLGATQNYQILGVSPDEYKPSQVYASAPNQAILSNTATAFLQGLYPPLTETNPELAATTLNNGTNSSAPLEGYQYILLQGVDDDSPNTIWIKGDDGCPAYTNSTKTFQESKEYKQRVESTQDFYAGFYQYLDEVYDLVPENMTYDNAYTIWDLLNVARIHNESASALDISDEDMFQLRVLADSFEFGSNYNASQPDRSIHAQTFSGGVLAQLNKTVATKGKLKFSLLAGSYDTFLAFFGITNLTRISDDFTGLPEYASTMAFELFSDDTDEFPPEEDLRIRWMFRNGTEGNLTAYPLFGQEEEVLSWSQFLAYMQETAITDAETWCDVCSATEDFCAAYDAGDVESKGVEGGKGGISNAVAGVIGAAVTLAVVAIVGVLVALFLVRKKRAAAGVATEKRSLDSGSVGHNAA